MKMSSLFNSVVCCAIMFGAPAVASEEMSLKDRYRQALQLLENDATAASLELVRLCSESYARACARAGYHALKGIGVEQNSAKAIAFYQKAILDGHSASLTSLGKVHLQRGAYEEAIQTFSKGSDADDPRASATLAWAHATNRLGDSSKPELGFATLLDTTQKGQRDAELLLLDALSKTPGKNQTSITY